MNIDGEYRQMRAAAFSAWAHKHPLREIKPHVFLEILEKVLSRQDQSGSFRGDGTPWEVVQTAVILKALARLGFSNGDTWKFYIKNGQHVSGSIKSAIDFLLPKLKSGTGADVGEDIWDTCQALLAAAAFEKQSEGIARSNRVNTDWNQFYEIATKSKDPSQWAGPAFLAAMIDVLNCYQTEITTSSAIPEMLDKLKLLELSENNSVTGCFPAVKSGPNTNRWNTALVLRTLGTLDQEYQDRALIERTVNWLLNELLNGGAWGMVPHEEAMFRARSYDGLQSVVRLVSPVLQDKIHKALYIGGKRLEELWSAELCDLKACTAVIEYLSSLTISVPAGLFLDVTRSIDADLRSPGIPDIMPDGFRLVWLSDLHVARQDDPQPSTMVLGAKKGWIRKFVGTFMYLKGTELTHRFQEQNLTQILAHVCKLNPDHILITGDLTNLGSGEQFRTVREKLLVTQSKLKKTDKSETKLDRSLFTILPGNHDVSDQNQTGGHIRHNLGMFFKHFADTYGDSGSLSNYDEVFPFIQTLGNKNHGLKIRLISLDSNGEWPVEVVGFNARGRIDKDQLTRFTNVLADAPDGELLLVALHHHPIVVPEMISDIESYFLSLDEAMGRRFVALCATSRVSAILHGHFHKFSIWSGLVPQGTRKMQIIGSPAGTMTIPGAGVEFLDLREAKLNNRIGLALYSHLWKDNSWTESYKTFID